MPKRLGIALGLIKPVNLNYPKLNRRFFISTNRQETLNEIISDTQLQRLLLKYKQCELSLTAGNEFENSEINLHFWYFSTVSDPRELREIYEVLREIALSIMEL